MHAYAYGEMAEWPNAAVSKAVILQIIGSGVRIPLSPPWQQIIMNVIYLKFNAGDHHVKKQNLTNNTY